MDDQQPNLDIILRAATEAGVRSPFTVSDLRKWAEERNRVAKGSGERSGQFLPEVSLNLPTPEARATTDFDKPDELDLPGEPEVWGDILDMEEPAEVKKVLGPSAKRSKAQAAADAAQAARVTRERTVPRKQLLQEDVAVAAEAAKKGATSVREFANHIPGRREAVKKAKARAAWVQEYGDEVVKEADALREGSEERLAAVAGMVNQFDAAMKRGDLDSAAGLRDQIQEAATAAAADKQAIFNARTKLEKLAKVEPPTKYSNATWEGVYQKPPKGFHVATPREFFDLQGNSPTYRGAWVADDPDDPENHISHILHHGKAGTSKAATRKAEAKPEYVLAQERKKWERVEAFKKFNPTLEKYWRDQLAVLDEKPKLTPAERQLKDDLTVALIAQVTGMRRGDDKNESALKSPDEIRSALMERAAMAGATPELLKQAEAAESLQEVMDVFDSDAKIKNHSAFKYDKKKSGLPEIYVPTYGATTLLKEHVTFNPDGTADFHFRGKSGVWNDIKLSDPQVVAAVKERHATAKDGEALFPGTTGRTLTEMMDKTIGEAQGLSAAEAEAAGTVDDEDDLTGVFRPHDLRRLWANTTAPEIFQRIMKEKGRLPEDIDEFSEWVAIAAVLAAGELGNEPGTFLKNYLSMASFTDVIQQMIAAGGSPDPEDYWQFGAKLGLPEGASVPEAVERGRVMGEAAVAKKVAARAAAARKTTAAKRAAAKKTPAKRTAPARGR